MTELGSQPSFLVAGQIHILLEFGTISRCPSSTMVYKTSAITDSDTTQNFHLQVLAHDTCAPTTGRRTSCQVDLSVWFRWTGDLMRCLILVRCSQALPKGVKRYPHALLPYLGCRQHHSVLPSLAGLGSFQLLEHSFVKNKQRVAQLRSYN